MTSSTIELAAVAVVVTGQSQGLMTAPGSQTSLGSANTVGTVTPMGGYGSTVNAKYNFHSNNGWPAYHDLLVS